MWRPGQRLGEYELLAKLRDGGMATLFLARRAGVAGFSRHVAIKVVHADLANDEQFRQMFLDEALLSSRIQHPNVVHVEELGRHGSAHFLVMEFVHGCSLSQMQRALLARGRRLSPAFAVRIAMHVAEALHAAHEARDDRGRLLNVVHRDVTPENVLLAYAGHVKLIDFGIAKAYGRRHRTQDGLLKGKFRYMAPEQALGRPVDRRVDIYQLGIVAWEMLTLRRLFDAERDIDLLAAVQRPRVAPPSAYVDGIPGALDVALMRALDPEPGSRPPDAQTFARMLARALPAAHEVDAQALRALLHGCMRDHREAERAVYPAGVYDQLERQVDTVAVAEPRVASISPTLRHGASHAPPAADMPTRPGPGALRRAASTTPALAPRVTVMDDGVARRARRYVQLAAPLEGMLTRALALPSSASGYWLGIGGAIGVAGALALLTLALRDRPRAVPELPIMPSAAQPAEVEPARDAGSATPGR